MAGANITPIPRLLALVFVSFCIAGLFTQQSAADDANREYRATGVTDGGGSPGAVQLEAVDERLEDLAERIERESGVRISVSARLKDELITKTVSAPDWTSAIKRLFYGFGLASVYDKKTGGLIRVVVMSNRAGPTVDSSSRLNRSEPEALAPGQRDWPVEPPPGALDESGGASEGPPESDLGGPEADGLPTGETLDADVGPPMDRDLPLTGPPGAEGSSAN